MYERQLKTKIYLGEYDLVSTVITQKKNCNFKLEYVSTEGDRIIERKRTKIDISCFVGRERCIKSCRNAYYKGRMTYSSILWHGILCANVFRPMRWRNACNIAGRSRCFNETT